jgi:hypothetical protein
MKKSKRNRLLLQSFASLIAMAVITVGIRPLLKEDTSYHNWWGGLVFAPVTIIIGLFLLYLVIFKWGKLSKMK